MAAKILDFMDTELERSPCMNGSHTTPNWPICLCCLHHNSLVMAPKSVFWYQIGSNTELTRSKLLIYLFYFLKKLCNDVATGLHGSSSSACQGLALNADPLREGMQPFHSPTPSTNELQPKTQIPTLILTLTLISNPFRRIQNMQSYLVFWASWAGTLDAEVLGGLNVHIQGCPQTTTQTTTLQ